MDDRITSLLVGSTPSTRQSKHNSSTSSYENRSSYSGSSRSKSSVSSYPSVAKSKSLNSYSVENESILKDKTEELRSTKSKLSNYQQKSSSLKENNYSLQSELQNVRRMNNELINEQNTLKQTTIHLRRSVRTNQNDQDAKEKQRQIMLGKDNQTLLFFAVLC